MDGLLKQGVKLVSESGNTYVIDQMIGAGGQGEVYSVKCNGKTFALKWYYQKRATKNQKKILENLIQKGAPSSVFLWPEDLIFNSIEKSFGYIMPLRPSNYKSIKDLMKRKAEPTFYTLSKAAYNLVKGFSELHKQGFSYSDISFGNAFFDPDTGDVLICDNDNVTFNGANPDMLGTPRFMAPEIVRREANPSRNTDLFSLAVLLFYMFMINHPLEGKRESEIKCMDIYAMNQLYGVDPLFIFDPINKDNAPVPGYQQNALDFWPIYPQALRDLFEISFTVGLNTPNKRVTENQWLDVLANMATGILSCPNGGCGVEVFYDPDKESRREKHICWYCSKEIYLPSKLVSGKSITLLYRNTKIYRHQIDGGRDMETVAGEVVQNPKNPNLYGIKNLTDDNWTYIKQDGTQVTVPSGRSAAIAGNCKINFGQLIGEFK